MKQFDPSRTEEKKNNEFGIFIGVTVTLEGVVADNSVIGQEYEIWVSMKIDAPAVISPKSRAPESCAKSRAKVSPAETQPASISAATGLGIARTWKSNSLPLPHYHTIVFSAYIFSISHWHDFISRKTIGDNRRTCRLKASAPTSRSC